jgi:hypothetical protein
VDSITNTLVQIFLLVPGFQVHFTSTPCSENAPHKPFIPPLLKQNSSCFTNMLVQNFLLQCNITNTLFQIFLLWTGFQVYFTNMLFRDSPQLLLEWLSKVWDWLVLTHLFRPICFCLTWKKFCFQFVNKPTSKSFFVQTGKINKSEMIELHFQSLYSSDSPFL